MKRYSFSILCLLAITLFTACQDDDNATPSPNATGALAIKFDNYVGTQPMQIDPEGSTDYRYTTGAGQEFNLSTFRYYISNIKLEGLDGATFEDEMNAGASADEVRGYYEVSESDPDTHVLALENVPAGDYNQVTFMVGVPEEGVQDGAAGGVLDQTRGTFWTWNSGYIHLTIEGSASAVPEEGNAFALHIGGWKEVEEGDNFVDNTRTVTLNFGDVATVREDRKPEVHIFFDMLEILNGAAVDFTQTHQVHSPVKAIPMADEIPGAFTVDHVH
ncbi:MbnP family protein [Tunicatimonas pelagia]|uniref:MbnP family protein n=1 Tax=Tunicatimonas pelagia TaxID=931531 RepID=UPI002666B7F8|nr:MbnP family protein [Tunicatimonas pelagia]WKN41903.1 hypothetical protein P0M28_22950 [Tunicatimonas pelagia]